MTEITNHTRQLAEQLAGIEELTPDNRREIAYWLGWLAGWRRGVLDATDPKTDESLASLDQMRHATLETALSVAEEAGIPPETVKADLLRIVDEEIDAAKARASEETR